MSFRRVLFRVGYSPAVMKMCFVFFCKQKTAYEMLISDWSSYVGSSDLGAERVVVIAGRIHPERRETDRALAERGPEEARIIGGIAQFGHHQRVVGPRVVIEILHERLHVAIVDEIGRAHV